MNTLPELQLGGGLSAGDAGSLATGLDQQFPSRLYSALTVGVAKQHLSDGQPLSPVRWLAHFPVIENTCGSNYAALPERRGLGKDSGKDGKDTF